MANPSKSQLSGDSHGPHDGEHVGPSGADLIAVERRRQVESEGWTPEHDAEHGAGDLATAASCYLDAAQPTLRRNESPQEPPTSWPWHPNWWKPSEDPIRNLVKAGALIAAEIDRLTRVKTDG